MMKPDTVSRPYILWLEWEGFYANGEAPEVVIRERTVFDANLSARAKGIVVGMSVPQVRNLARECRLKKWVAEEYESRGEEWLDFCPPFTGLIEQIDSHIAALDLSGHPKPGDIASRIIRYLGPKPYGILRYGAGPAKWIAQLASQSGDLTMAINDPAAFLTHMPVKHLLTIDTAHLQRLEFLGYPQIGQVACLPMDVLRGQFGEDAHFISQAANGGGSDPVSPNYPRNVIHESFPFVSPVDDIQILEAVWARLADQLIPRLTGKQVGEMTLIVQWEDEKSDSVTRRFTRPIVNSTSLKAAIQAQNEIRREGKVGVAGLAIVLSRIQPARPQQQAFFVAKEQLTPDHAVRALQETFGERAVVMATHVEIPRRKRVLKEWQHATGWV